MRLLVRCEGPHRMLFTRFLPTPGAQRAQPQETVSDDEEIGQRTSDEQTMGVLVEAAVAIAAVGQVAGVGRMLLDDLGLAPVGLMACASPGFPPACA